MKAPEFKYEPVQVSFKHKLNLRDLTPANGGKSIMVKFITSFLIAWAIVMTLSICIAWLGNTYNF